MSVIQADPSLLSAAAIHRSSNRHRHHVRRDLAQSRSSRQARIEADRIAAELALLEPELYPDPVEEAEIDQLEAEMCWDEFYEDLYRDLLADEEAEVLQPEYEDYDPPELDLYE